MRSILLPLIPKKFLAAQLRKPSGLFGKILMGYFLNQHNERMNHFAVEMLDLQPTDAVLDIGFGGGVTIEKMLTTIDSGKIYGVDFSQVMVEQAKEKFRSEIEAEKVSIECADVRELPFNDNTFDKVCTVNTIYFWSDPIASLRSIKRVMKSGGKLVIGIRSADKMKDLPVTQYNFKLYSPEAVRDLLIEAGFNGISNGLPSVPAIEHRDDLKLDYVMVIACA
jgi:ubiquinone/menaquinone biosynthesis C-methylase UbiE